MKKMLYKYFINVDLAEIAHPLKIIHLVTLGLHWKKQTNTLTQTHDRAQSFSNSNTAIPTANKSIMHIVRARAGRTEVRGRDLLGIIYLYMAQYLFVFEI